jgi:uridine kinase
LPITNIEDIPRTSLIREFIGRSVFKYWKNLLLL